MAKPTEASAEGSAIEDVRRIRELFSREANGDIRRHVEQTQTAFQELQTHLHLRTVTPDQTTVPSQQ